MPDKCKSCRKPIVWAVTEQRKFIPLDPDETPGSNLVISDEVENGETMIPVVRYVKAGDGNRTTHFATCPKADEHRKAKT